jgi:hypothetical protein
MVINDMEIDMIIDRETMSGVCIRFTKRLHKKEMAIQTVDNIMNNDPHYNIFLNILLYALFE